MKNLLKLICFMSISLASVTLTIESLTTQYEYETWESGEYLIGTLEVGITTDENIRSIQMSISQYNDMGTGTPYGGLVEELDWYMGALLGDLIFGYHYMFPQDYYIPAGTTDETLMYVPIRISEENDDEFCIQDTEFIDLDGNPVTVILDENSCISLEDMTVNGMPVAIINDGAEDAEAEMGSTFTLDATSSFDPDGTIESYFWSQSSEGTQVEFSSESESIVTFTVPTEENDDYVCIVSLTVTDNDGNTAMSQLTITGIEPESGGSVTLTIESLTTQNEYFTSYSGEEYLMGTLEIGITTDDDIVAFSMGISHYNGMGVGQAYGGLVEEYDFEMNNIFGSLITGGHNMFPQDYYIPAGTTDETLMYVPILISETNDEEFCIIPVGFSNLEGDSLTVILNENSCISLEDMCLDEDNDGECDNASIEPISIINDGSPSMTAPMGSQITLDGSTSYDLDGTIIDYSWSQSADGDQGVFSSTNEAVVIFTVPSNMDIGLVACIIWLTVTDDVGNEHMSELVIMGTNDALDLSDDSNTPEKFKLNQNYPNPFNPVTSLSYNLPQDSHVSIIIYDMLGNVINNLVNTNQSSGYKIVQWNATDNLGQPVSAGVYLYKIQAGDFVDTKKMILLK